MSFASPITNHQIQLYRWYEQGVTDTNDLSWLMSFYRQSHGWNHNTILSSIQAARIYYQENTNDVCENCPRPLP